MIASVLSFGAGLALAAAAVPVPGDAAPAGFRVTYLMFSGRPNPSLTITGRDEVRALEQRLRTASAQATLQAGGNEAEEPALGYSGIRIERLDATGATAAPLAVVGRGGRLRFGGGTGDAARIMQSEDGELEQYLLDAGVAGKVLDPEALAAFGAR